MERQQSIQASAGQTTPTQSPTFIPIPHHSQIIHPAVIPIVPGQILIPPHLFDGEHHQKVLTTPSKQITDQIRAIPETTQTISNSALSIGEHKGLSYVTVQAPQPITPSGASDNSFEKQAADISALSSILDTSKSAGQNSDQVLYYLMQTGSKETPLTYVAYVVPKTAGAFHEGHGDNVFNDEAVLSTTVNANSRGDVDKEFKYTSLRDVLCENKNSNEL